ncbi:MAG: YihY/virulence factor BrkB family protein [Phycisphaerales bacterium]
MSDDRPPIDEHEELTRTVSVVRAGLRGLYKSGLPRMAAALAYRTIFSIIPVLAIALVIASGLISPEQVRDSFTKLLEYAGFQTIVVSTDDAKPVQIAGPPEPGAEATEIAAPVKGQSVSVPVLKDEAEQVERGDGEVNEERVAAADELLTNLVEHVSSSLGAINRGWIGFVSAGVFIYAALSLFLEIERSFNQIYRVQRGRGWVARLLLYWTMLTLGSILLLATFSVGQRFTEWVEALLGGTMGSRWTLGLAGYGVTVLISTTLLWIVYTTVPNVRVAARPALVGAFLGAVVWELGKWGFTQYVEYSTAYAKFYGSLALLPLFMLWVYVTWLIVLFGLQVTYALEHFSELRDPQPPADHAPTVLDPAMILLVASAIARRFEGGKDGSPAEIGAELGVDDDVVERMCAALDKAQIVHRVESDSPGERYTMAAPPASVAARDVFNVGLGLSGGESAVLGELDKARGEALGDRTLADVAAKSAPPGRARLWGSGEGRAKAPKATAEGSNGAPGASSTISSGEAT